MHGEYKTFDTEAEMRAHWVECHKITLEEEFLMLLVPDSSKEPPTAENRPVPVNVRLVAKEFSTGSLMLEKP